jgi:3-oxoacyl-[acyl-carrier-protein] synthase III
MDKVNAALRWILADGAGAIVLQAGQNGLEGRDVIGTYVESVGGDLPAGMTAGGAAADLVKADRQIPQLYQDGCHHLWQDFNAVKERAGRLLLNGVLRFTQQLGIPPGQVDHYVASIPTRDLYEAHIQSFQDTLGVERERMKFRAARVGYCGGATPLLHFDDMVRSGEVRPGQLVIVHAVESSKWMTAGFAVRW